MDPLFKSVASVVPAADLTALAALLGRPSSKIETTPHRFCQAAMLWRRVAIAIMQAASDPPSSEYARLTDLVSEHSADRAGKRKAGFSNVVCVSPFEAVSSVVDWITSIKGLPLSVLQALCLIPRGGSCDPWLEDPKQSQRGGRFAYELLGSFSGFFFFFLLFNISLI